MAVRDLAKTNGAKNDAQPGKKHAHGHGAGDEDDHDSDACSEAHEQIYPENIHKRVQALKNLHLDVQKVKSEFDKRVFLLEAEYHKKMTPLLEKRSKIVNGSYEPNAAESKFSLKSDDAPADEMLPSDGKAGIPKFWLEVLSSSGLTREVISDADLQVLEHLNDVRVVYTEKPLGFKLEFEFAENLFFTNKILTRTYEFDDSAPTAEMYINTGLSPKTTAGTVIDWKDKEKNVTKKVVTTTQRNKKTGERRQITKEEDVESFFTFFAPSATDLADLTKQANTKALQGVDEANDEALQEKVQTAEMDFELASVLRTRIIPRALLIFTGEDDDNEDYSEDDYDDEEEDEEEEDPSSTSEDEKPPTVQKRGGAAAAAGPGGKAGKK